MKKLICIVLVLTNLLLIVCGCSQNIATGDITETEMFGIGGIQSYYGKTRNWKQYSTSNYFKISDEEVFDYSEEVLDADDDESILSYYNRDFGTFPVMAGIGYGKRVSYEFAAQHYEGSDADLQMMTRAIPIQTYPAYKGFYYDCLHKDSEVAWGEVILKEEEDKQVFLRTERPVDVLFDPSGIPIDESELEFKDVLKDIEYDTVCYDAMVFFTSEENEIDSLTTRQIRDIYSGATTNWIDVGGSDIKIDVYHRGGSTMNRDYMEKVVMSGLEIKESNSIKLNEPWEHLGVSYEYYPKEYVNSKTAIGYGYKSLIDRYYPDDIKILRINGVAPTAENIRLGKYEYSIPCLAATRKDKTGTLGKKVIEWLKSNEGKKSMEQIGYIPVE